MMTVKLSTSKSFEGYNLNIYGKNRKSKNYKLEEFNNLEEMAKKIALDIQNLVERNLNEIKSNNS